MGRKRKARKSNYKGYYEKDASDANFYIPQTTLASRSKNMGLDSITSTDHHAAATRPIDGESSSYMCRDETPDVCQAQSTQDQWVQIPFSSLGSKEGESVIHSNAGSEGSRRRDPPFVELPASTQVGGLVGRLGYFIEHHLDLGELDDAVWDFFHALANAPCRIRHVDWLDVTESLRRCAKTRFDVRYNHRRMRDGSYRWIHSCGLVSNIERTKAPHVQSLLVCHNYMFSTNPFMFPWKNVGHVVWALGSGDGHRQLVENCLTDVFRYPWRQDCRVTLVRHVYPTVMVCMANYSRKRYHTTSRSVDRRAARRGWEPVQEKWVSSRRRLCEKCERPEDFRPVVLEREYRRVGAFSRQQADDADSDDNLEKFTNQMDESSAWGLG
ncbi:hypothetical protein ONE63_010351 [Megalurothrips usitatus]|uniref:Uncharacterized protein n=1 Tax=Megalurothrips usitatus TaxID=439358 RepID=A0AAV7XLP6_9NEOP|nr:hypothetical protein ONE63_010351 [Megalurothrips usitatus]